MRFLSTLLLILLLGRSHSYKILVYNSKYAHSHSNFLGQIADILVDAGHDVTSLLPIMDSSVSDGTVKSTKIYVDPDPIVKDMFGNQMDDNTQAIFEANIVDPTVPFMIGPVFGDVFYRTCKRVLDEPGLIDRMHEEQFDVMITENFDVCGIGITKSIAPKSVIGVSSTSIIGWQFSDWGVPQALSYRPTSMTSSLDVHSLFDRMYNIYGEILGRLIFWYYRQAVTSALKEKFGPDHPTISELSSNVAYVFTNSEPLISSAAPTISRVIEIGGIRAKQPKMLDEYWEGILTQLSKAVLLSFGSIAKSSRIPHAMKMGIIKAMTRIPNVTFIWKYEEPDDDFCKEHATKVDNLVLTKWMPQVDLLAHPNMAAFITHGGMGSTQEIAQRGVPGIFIPLFADQPYNAEMMQLNGLGRVFDKHELHDDEKLAETISDVIDNPKYQFNAKRTSAMLAKKPFTSRELLIKHVEFAAEFGKYL